MSNDFSPINNPESESPMFAGVPSWERGKKGRNFGSRGSRVAAEPRSFAPEYAPEPGDPIPTRPVNLSEDARAYEARMDTVDPTDTTFASGATFADRTKRKGGATAPLLVAAGIILVGGLAAGGWYAMQPHNTGVAELTPGTDAATTTTTATTPGDTTTAATSAPTQVAQNTTPPAPAAAAAHATTVTTTTHASKAVAVHTTVTRAPPARSASEAGANASTTAAPAPIPVPAPAAAPPTAAAPPAPLVLTLPPQAAPTTPAPAPTETPLPTQTAPPSPPTATPN